MRVYADEKASDTENAEFLFHPKVQAVAKVLADLIDQQWNFEISENGLWLKRATLDEKVIREHARSAQRVLAAPSVLRFWMNGVSQHAQRQEVYSSTDT